MLSYIYMHCMRPTYLFLLTALWKSQGESDSRANLEMCDQGPRVPQGHRSPELTKVIGTTFTVYEEIKILV